jgi:tetratricopeptide (TPR) repeat protein
MTGAELHLRQALAALRGSQERYGIEGASLLDALGLVLRRRGRLDDAESSFRAGLALARSTPAADDLEGLRPRAAFHLAELLAARGRASEARSIYAEAAEQSAALDGESSAPSKGPHRARRAVALQQIVHGGSLRGSVASRRPSRSCSRRSPI